MSEIKTEPKYLRDLNPKWLEKDGIGIYGIQFECPCGTPPVHACDGYCNDPCPYSKWPGCLFGMITIWFADTSNPQGSSASGEPLRWNATHAGTFDTLSLQPSIHCVGHVHGFITDGMWMGC